MPDETGAVLPVVATDDDSDDAALSVDAADDVVSVLSDEVPVVVLPHAASDAARITAVEIATIFFFIISSMTKRKMLMRFFCIAYAIVLYRIDYVREFAFAVSLPTIMPVNTPFVNRIIQCFAVIKQTGQLFTGTPRR